MRLAILFCLLALSLGDYTMDWVEVPLDHFKPQDTRTFKIRYWYDDDGFDFNDPDAPIFLYICGESICTPLTQEGRGFPLSLAKENNGLMLVLEHRYYGYSQPFEDWRLENLKYLTINNALADMAHFLTWIDSDLQKRYGGPPRKIITMGGSYPGALSAWFRSKYPHIANGAIASSAVVHAVADMWEYDT